MVWKNSFVIVFFLSNTLILLYFESQNGNVVRIREKALALNDLGWNPDFPYYFSAAFVAFLNPSNSKLNNWGPAAYYWCENWSGFYSVVLEQCLILCNHCMYIIKPLLYHHHNSHIILHLQKDIIRVL